MERVELKPWLVLRIFSGALALAALQAATALAALKAYDDFNYPSIGSDLTGNGDGGSFGFTGPWIGQTSYNIGNGSLTAPGDPLPKVGNSVTAVAFTENRGIDRDFTSNLAVENTTIYVSMLMQPQGILHQGAYGGWFGMTLRGSTDITVGMGTYSDNYGLEYAGTTSLTNAAAVVGKPVFFVLRIDFTEGVDPAYLYVNPRPGAPEPLTPSASQINLGVNSITRLSITGPGSLGFDSLRIGTTYADVAPATTDFNNDAKVDNEDFALWKAGFGSLDATSTNGDSNNDSDADGGDFLLWQRQRGWQNLSAAAAIPEPTTQRGLVAGALAVLMARRRNHLSNGK